MAQFDSLAMSKGWSHVYDDRIISVVGSAPYRITPDGYFDAVISIGWPQYTFQNSNTSTLREVSLNGVKYQVREVGGDVRSYDTSGRLVSIRNASRPESDIYLSYAAGRLSQLTTVDGRVASFVYTSGKLSEISLPDGLVIAYRYGQDGNLSEVEYGQGGGKKKYFYGESGQGPAVDFAYLLTGIESEDGRRYATFSYNENGWVTRSVLQGDGGAVDKTVVRYVSEDVVEVESDRTGVETINIRRGLFPKPSSVTSVAGQKVLTYGNAYLQRAVDRMGGVTEYQYVGNLPKLITSGVGTAAERSEKTVYDSNSRPIRHETYSGTTVLRSRADVAYDAAGRTVATCRHDVVGGAITYPCGSSDAPPATVRQRRYQYCTEDDVLNAVCPRAGLLLSETESGPVSEHLVKRVHYHAEDAINCAVPGSGCDYRKGDLWKVTNAKGQVVEYVKYDGAGRPLSVKDPNGVITDYEYHPRGWLTASKVRGTNDTVETDDAITRVAYWPTGLVKQVTQPDGAFTLYTYDAAHRLTDISDNAGNTIHYVLDNAGNRITEETKDAGGALKRTLSRIYNQLGQLATQADAQAHPTDFTYDANGNANTVTDALGRVTDHDHDPLNRLARTLQDVGGIAAETKFQYDALDNLTKVTDPKGLDTTYTYNGLGDLIQLQSQDTGTTTYTYDSAGNRASQTDARGVTTTYAHDALNRLTAVNYPDTALNVSYTYDTVPTACEAGETFGVGRLSGMDDASGSTRYCYNRFGHLVRKVQTTNGVNFVVRYAYTLAGNLQAMVYPDGTTVDYGRNAQGQVTEVGVTRSDQPRQVLLHQASYHPFGPVAGWTYGNGRSLSRTLDQDYRPLTIEDPNTGGLSLGFGYDAVGNLTKLGTAQGVATPAIRFGYDALGRLTRTEDGPTQAAIDVYAYDATGNRTAHTTAAGTSAYTYPATSHRLTDVAGVPRTYDAVGNTTAIGGTRGFAYNDANRMSLVQQSGVTTRQYAYNGRGEQVRRYLGATNIYTVYDEAGHWLGDYDDSGAPVQQALWMDDLPVGLLANGQQLHYLQPDHLGSPRVVIEAARNVPVWTWDLKGEAFGSTAPQQDPDGDGIPFVLDMRFPGQRYDVASALNYNYFRDYNPAAGRFQTSDPIGQVGGLSTYGYAGMNPLRSIDPNGLDFFDPVFELVYQTTGGWSPSQGMVDAVAGFGDSLSFSLSAKYRDYHGIGSVNKCSSAYRNGEIAGTAYSLAVPVSRLAYVAKARQIPGLGLSAMESVAARNALKDYFRGPFAGILKNWHAVTYEGLIAQGKAEAAIIAGAGRTSLPWTTGIVGFGLLSSGVRANSAMENANECGCE
ncbi:RHS repeat-associated core domain-containing protein [Pseudoxanthomonas sp. 22568]|uniref:RHS repeat-associated core domain-containing protein n=1 Tax=Pseudoxanthomonas sp. 22568 TaxID=3453945 RepID=UPI003F8681ED